MNPNITPFEDIIKKYLDNYAKQDEEFAKRYSNENKSIDKCCKFIYQEVEKQLKENCRFVGCADKEIYGLAVHYYDEEDIVVDGPKLDVQKVEMIIPEEPKPTKRKRTKKEVVDENIPEPLIIPIF